MGIAKTNMSITNNNYISIRENINNHNNIAPIISLTLANQKIITIIKRRNENQFSRLNKEQRVSRTVC